MSYHVRIEITPDKGRGVFANKAFKRGEIIEVCPVILVEENTCKDTILEKYVFDWVGSVWGLVLGYGSLYNHSNDPNATWEKFKSTNQIKFIACKPIKTNQEITISYDSSGSNLFFHGDFWGTQEELIKCKEKQKRFMTPDHPQKKVHNPWCGDIYVDRGIAELLCRLWTHGIETENSCQENKPDIIWIQFYRAQDCEKFYTHIARNDKEFFYNELVDDFERAWWFKDENEVLVEQINEIFPNEEPDVCIKPSIRFPKKHYRKLLKLFAT